jgi:hypothetical protein
MLAARGDGGFFHTSVWARILHETYRHEPAYFCVIAGGRLEVLLPIMEVRSWLTGKRGVSLPFTDFCPPLKSVGRGSDDLYASAVEHGKSRGWRYLECRGHGGAWAGAKPSLGFYGHSISLQAGAEALFRGFESAMRRGIRKAEGAKLQVEFGGSRELVEAYYALHCLTRRKHGLPPQPKRFFQNIGRYALEPGLGFIALVRLGKRAIAGMVFLCHGRQAIYKFGASDPGFQQLRPNNLLMWEGIKQCLARGVETLHLGRTSLGHDGLRRYKLAFGAQEERIEYQKYDFGESAFVMDADRTEGWFNLAFRALPGPLLRMAGNLLYPHQS